MKVTVPYKLNKTEAVKRIKNLLLELQTEYKGQVSDVKSRWTDSQAIYSFKMNGLQIKGTILINDRNVIVNGKLPLIAMAFRSQIENIIRQKATELLK